MNEQLQTLAALAQEYQHAVESNYISVNDYKQLVANLNLAEQINQQADDLEEDILARQVIMGALQLASSLS